MNILDLAQFVDKKGFPAYSQGIIVQDNFAYVTNGYNMIWCSG